MFDMPGHIRCQRAHQPFGRRRGGLVCVVARRIRHRNYEHKYLARACVLLFLGRIEEMIIVDSLGGIPDHPGTERLKDLSGAALYCLLRRISELLAQF